MTWQIFALTACNLNLITNHQPKHVSKIKKKYHCQIWAIHKKTSINFMRKYSRHHAASSRKSHTYSLVFCVLLGITYTLIPPPHPTAHTHLYTSSLPKPVPPTTNATTLCPTAHNLHNFAQACSTLYRKPGPDFLCQASQTLFLHWLAQVPHPTRVLPIQPWPALISCTFLRPQGVSAIESFSATRKIQKTAFYCTYCWPLGHRRAAASNCRRHRMGKQPGESGGEFRL